jgi:signal transduction histidine kinase
MQTPNPPDNRSRAPLQTIAEFSDVIVHLQDVMEEERIRLSRSLHDDLGGLLVSAVMDLGWVEQNLAEPGELRERLHRVRNALSAAIDLKRNIIEELRPSLLDNFGLFAAYRWHVQRICKRAGVTCSESYPDDELKLRPEALAGLFRIMQETLAVILAEPSLELIDVSVAVDGSTLLLQTAHTHVGLETIDVVEQSPARLGAIAQRIGSFSGNLEVDRHATGTTMFARFPMDQLLAPA